MKRGVAVAIASMALALTATAGQADQTHWTVTPEGYAKHLSDVGAWEFSALKKDADGKPECVETWTFNKDGGGSVVSGEQRLEILWRYVKDDELGMLLRIDYQSSTAGKDCLGREVDPSKYPKPDLRGIELLFYGDGDRATVCNAPMVVVDEKGEFRKGADGKVITLQSLENCWGSLNPIKTK